MAHIELCFVENAKTGVHSLPFMRLYKAAKRHAISKRLPLLIDPPEVGNDRQFNDWIALPTDYIIMTLMHGVGMVHIRTQGSIESRVYCKTSEALPRILLYLNQLAKETRR